MADYQELWANGYRDGWNEQSTRTPPQPAIPPMPTIPTGTLDPEDWVYAEGRKRGVIDRMKVQAGLG
ncbi:hypothetical protein [Roseateles sp.]|uniref:hypothetical protein n=1 Tax=Roseateles sp. TaxID=1971397 RepID=UPI0039E73AC1